LIVRPGGDGIRGHEFALDPGAIQQALLPLRVSVPRAERVKPQAGTAYQDAVLRTRKIGQNLMFPGPLPPADLRLVAAVLYCGDRAIHGRNVNSPAEHQGAGSHPVAQALFPEKLARGGLQAVEHLGRGSDVDSPACQYRR